MLEQSNGEERQEGQGRAEKGEEKDVTGVPPTNWEAQRLPNGQRRCEAQISRRRLGLRQRAPPLASFQKLEIA